jgi:pimeloyl-ACP methyl ester carboxylesterase
MEFEVDGQRAAGAGRVRGSAAGPAIVFVHGAAMDHSVWVYHTRYFAHNGRSVLALDLPAHGHSSGPPLPSIDAMASWLWRALDAAGLEQVALAGHSMGALVCLAAAAAQPARVARLALLGAAFPMPVSDALLEAARAERPAARDMMVVWGHAAAAQFGANPVAGIHIVWSALRLLERAAPGLLYNDLKACHDYAGGGAAAVAVTAPTTLICGSDDRMTPPAAARQFAVNFAQANVAVIRGSGHIMMSERPEHTHRELVAALA